MSARYLLAWAVIPLAIQGVHAPVATAGSCGGRGSGGGGGGHGGGGGGHGHDARVDPAREGCTDASDVVGYRHCTRYGAWGKSLRSPRIVIEAGALVRQFPSLLDGQTGSVAHGGEAFSYRAAAATSRGRAIDTAVLSTMRAGVGLPHGLRTGLEVDLGGIAQPGQAQTEMSAGVFGSPDLAQRHGFIVDSLATLGLHRTLGVGRVGLELAGGLRAVSYGFRSDYHDCTQTTSITALGAIAEARAQGQLWLSPWLTAGVTVGSSMIEKNSWMGGLYIGVHSRAYGGER
jgi:hypothetical protein